MSVELKEFGGAYFPKDKALKKTPELKPLAILVKALNKGIAEAVIFGRLAAEHPEHIDDYFKVKIWEHREGLPCPELDVLSPDFFGSSVVWNVNAGEPANTQPEDDETQNQSDDRHEEEMKSVRLLDQHSRAACLALFGPIEQITAAQYGQVVDLINDDDGCFQREMAEAFTKETRVFALSTERQEEMLAWIRKTMLVSTQWPEIKKQLTKWLDTPAAKRNSTESGNKTEPDTEATLGGNNQTDRSPDLVHNLATLRIETALGIIASAMDFDIYSIPVEIMRRAKDMESKGGDPRFSAWWTKLRGTPGILDYPRTSIIALIKSAPEDLYLKPVDLRAYINRELVESDHANPNKKTVAIACGTVKTEQQNDETKPSVQSETDLPAVCPGKAAQLDKELNDAFAQRKNDEQIGRELAAGRGEYVEGISDPSDQKWVDGSTQPRVENLGGGVFSVDALMEAGKSTPPALIEREIEIAYALNELMSGRSRELSLEEAEGDVLRTGYTVSHLIALLIDDISATEFCLSPDLEIDEIQMVAACILGKWSDDVSERQKIALDAIVEYRRPTPQEEAHELPVSESVIDVTSGKSFTATIYQRQLTCAALQGLCANPAYCNQYEDLPTMAAWLASTTMALQENSDAC